MPESTDQFYRIEKLPPYVFAVINEMKAEARAAQQDVIDLGMGNPDGATPRIIVNKMIEAARNPRNHRYSQSKGIPKLREEIVKRYKDHYDVDLDPGSEAIVTIGAKDALLINKNADRLLKSGKVAGKELAFRIGQEEVKPRVAEAASARGQCGSAPRRTATSRSHR